MNVFMNFVRPALIKQQSKEKEAANTDTLSKESESPAIFSFWFTPPLKQEVHDEVRFLSFRPDFVQLLSFLP